MLIHQLSSVLLIKKQEITENFKSFRILHHLVHKLYCFCIQAVARGRIPHVQESELDEQVWKVIRQARQQERAPIHVSTPTKFVKRWKKEMEVELPVVSYPNNLCDVFVFQYLMKVFGHSLA